jgi:hypothetical protein
MAVTKDSIVEVISRETGYQKKKVSIDRRDPHLHYQIQTCIGRGCSYQRLRQILCQEKAGEEKAESSDW